MGLGKKEIKGIFTAFNITINCFTKCSFDTISSKYIWLWRKWKRGTHQTKKSRKNTFRCRQWFCWTRKIWCSFY